MARHTQSAHAMPFGAELRPDGQTRFRLWAPGREQVELELHGPDSKRRFAMARTADGWHELMTPAPAGTRYLFRMPEGLAVPDPASRFNPDGVHAASAVVDPLAYAWRDGAWRGRRWEEAVFYELHVGTFTPEGTYSAARARLGELADLGITALELMPLAQFPGQRNWGYDGVLPFAPHAGYGDPQALKALVDDAHARGLMVLLDVVYNHFGPEGNYLHAYCPQFFNPAHQTPWGAAINYDGPDAAAVRRFFIHNALYWVEEFHFDGLRLDAVHAIRDDSPTHIVREMARALRNGPGRERHAHLVLENDGNQARFLERGAGGAPRYADAQWNDDVHHACHVLLTGERDGYYADYADAPFERLGRALAEGFAYQGEASAFRGGAARGEPSAHLPPSAFVAFLQTHDQVGNRAFGERLHRLADPLLERTAIACLLLAPQTPLLFMGEEWGASTPFLYFCDFGPELAEAVSRGRRAEFGAFAAFGQSGESAESAESGESTRSGESTQSGAGARALPEPNDPATFEASKLCWAERDAPEHRERLAFVRELLILRRRHIVPLLAGLPSGQAAVEDAVLRVRWRHPRGTRLDLVANFGPQAREISAVPPGTELYARHVNPLGESGLRLQPGGVRWSLETPTAPAGARPGSA